MNFQGLKRFTEFVFFRKGLKDLEEKLVELRGTISSIDPTDKHRILLELDVASYIRECTCGKEICNSVACAISEFNIWYEKIRLGNKHLRRIGIVRCMKIVGWIGTQSIHVDLRRIRQLTSWLQEELKTPIALTRDAPQWFVNG